MSTKKNGNNNGSKIKLGNLIVDLDKIRSINTSSLPFLNPADDFIGIIQPLSEIRLIAKKGEMKQDLYIVDVKVINAVETKEEETEMDGEVVIRHVKKSYTDQAVSFVLSKAVLLSKFKKLQEEGLLNQRTTLLIAGLGKREGKDYYDFYIAPIEEAKKQGIVMEWNKQ